MHGPLYSLAVSLFSYLPRIRFRRRSRTVGCGRIRCRKAIRFTASISQRTNYTAWPLVRTARYCAPRTAVFVGKRSNRQRRLRSPRSIYSTKNGPSRSAHVGRSYAPTMAERSGRSSRPKRGSISTAFRSLLIKKPAISAVRTDRC